MTKYQDKATMMSKPTAANLSTTAEKEHNQRAKKTLKKTHTLLPPEGERLIGLDFITAYTGLSDKYFYALIKKGMFPRPIKLSRSSRWKKSELDKWIEERVAKR
ncbi:helix-turn-helix transcriptional regulator [Kluyvera ascorbata]|uniref:helix-turn-helix transcriptional regulator n=1 Tax=Kluyvera ascorbata TaxID=51288 RepID=UPI0004E2A847|nr:AlpA family phage regulatory protein [Kluyvera ascorbata]KFC93911.1 hypothetical protein GKAS_04120 [Kluyvera ascorbata ATCC 33433]BCA38793.1 hypothetical protein KATP_13150 [Kluyvera ascorbata]STW98038.1 Predicted transcriptional regulator [Kluyvera ascorbata]